jgi:hypothetical protein
MRNNLHGIVPLFYSSLTAIFKYLPYEKFLFSLNSSLSLIRTNKTEFSGRDIISNVTECHFITPNISCHY